MIEEASCQLFKENDPTVEFNPVVCDDRATARKRTSLGTRDKEMSLCMVHACELMASELEGYFWLPLESLILWLGCCRFTSGSSAWMEASSTSSKKCPIEKTLPSSMQQWLK